MATMQAALRMRLLLDPTCSALVGDRVHWGQRPQGGALPAVVLHLIDGRRSQHLKGFDPLRESVVQVDCLAASDIAGDELLEAAIAAAVVEATALGIRFCRAAIDRTYTLGEQAQTQFIHRASADMRFWWCEA